MLAESESKIEQRFLTTDCKFGKEAIEIWKGETRIRCRDKEKTKSLIKYLNWQESENEIALFTMYAYADFEIPKQFSCIFDYRNPNRFVKTNMTLNQSIWEGWLPVNYIDHGHKHLAIFKFDEQIPEITNELHEEKNKFSSVPKDSLYLGICQFENYELIKKDLIKIQELRNKYGANWSDYYEIDK